MTRVAAILAALALVLLLGISSATGDTPPAEYRIYLPEAHRAPLYYIICKVEQDVCDEPPAIRTATPWPTAALPPAISITRTPTP
jgi:hypothetical protein